MSYKWLKPGYEGGNVPGSLLKQQTKNQILLYTSPNGILVRSPQTPPSSLMPQEMIILISHRRGRCKIHFTLGPSRPSMAQVPYLSAAIASIKVCAARAQVLCTTARTSLSETNCVMGLNNPILFAAMSLNNPSNPSNPKNGIANP